MLESVRLAEALGYAVGDLLVISAEAFDTCIAGTTPRRVRVEWPWREIDPESANSWDGTMAFSRDPEAYDWCNTPWRLEPDPSELQTGDACFVGIPPTEVKVVGIEKYDPPADFGFLPRPDYVLEVVPLDMIDDEEAGFVLYLNGEEPIDIEMASRAIGIDDSRVPDLVCCGEVGGGYDRGSWPGRSQGRGMPVLGDS